MPPNKEATLRFQLKNKMAIRKEKRETVLPHEHFPCNILLVEAK